MGKEGGKETDSKNFCKRSRLASICAYVAQMPVNGVYRTDDGGEGSVRAGQAVCALAFVGVSLGGDVGGGSALFTWLSSVIDKQHASSHAKSLQRARILAMNSTRTSVKTRLRPLYKHLLLSATQVT